MMMLGLVLHTAVAYMRTPIGDLWGYKDAHTHVAFDALAALLHTFRVPVFFVLAGFFGALLYARRGATSMIWNRVQRVLVPLVVGWIILFPVTIAGFAFAQLGGTPPSALVALRYATSAAALQHLQLLHLWFLFDLLLYYAVALLLVRLMGARTTPGGRRAGGLDWLVQRWYGPLALAVVTAVTLLPMASGTLETPGTFQRPPGTLVADGVFFALGWWLYARRELLPQLGARAWGRTLAACALFPVYAWALLRMSSHSAPGTHLVAITSLALTTWLFVFGLTGLFVRYLAKPSPVGRYVADASYWFYLIHLPLVAWGTGLLAGVSWPAGVKYLAVLGGVVAVCWVTYDFAVRSTVVGAILNGRRNPRGLPRAAAG
jgi:glucan biosynthesis protein C